MSSIEKRKTLTKTLLIMKFTAILLLVFTVQISAKGFSQTISLSLKNVSLDKAFLEIEKQSGFSFVYGKEQLVQTRSVTLSVLSENIESVLDKLFKDQPLTYTITDKYISVKQKPAEVIAPKPVDITGKVVNDKGEPMVGVTVAVKGTKIATTTAEDGSFKIAAPNDNSVLVFTNVGFERMELPLNGKTSVISVSMRTATSSLNEVIVTGYSSQRKKDITGAVSVVKVSDLLTTPSPNVTSQLQGRASGVTITNDNLPGNGAIVRIRGFASFSGQPGGNDPLYIIDEFPVMYQRLTLQTLNLYRY